LEDHYKELMEGIKVYIGCCKADFYLLRSCIASIRYWNREVPVYLLKDFSKGKFDTAELERVFNVSVVDTKYKKLGGYMKLQPYIENPGEKIFLLDADMVWLGNMMEVLKNECGNIAVHAYCPEHEGAELNSWYFNTEKLKRYYPGYIYPGFVFNCGSIFFDTKLFSEADFKNIIVWQEGATPVHDDVFLCEDQGIINYIVAVKYLQNSITLNKVELQISAENDSAKMYVLDKILRNEPRNIIVHWLGKKSGLNAFCSSNHLLRFYEKKYYSQLPNGAARLQLDRLKRTILHFDKFLYEFAKKIYYTFIPRKNEFVK
jgi:hypothetical protein